MASAKDNTMFVSTIIPTIGRPTLARAVESVITQDLADDFEVIVVNDTGRPLPAADWQRTTRVRTVTTCRRERSIARNTGAAMARGRYLHFLDDDDWLLPGAFLGLKQLADASRGLWLYGGSQLVDRQGARLIELHHHIAGNCALQVMAGEWIPLQSSLFDAELFFTLGGFNPLVAGAEDIDLTRRVALRTDAAGAPTLVACIGMGTEGSSTDCELSRRDMRWTRETALGQPNTFRRLRAGAASAYWGGRLARIYLTSALWNARQGRITTALSRSTYATGCLVLASRWLFNADFYRALAKAYRNDSFQRGFAQATWQGTAPTA